MKLINFHGGSSNKISFLRLKAFFSLIYNSNLLKLFKKTKIKYAIISTQRYVEGSEIYTSDIKSLLSTENYIEFSMSDNFNFYKGNIVYLDFFKVFFRVISNTLKFVFPVSNNVKNFFREFDLNDKFIFQYRIYMIEYRLWFYFYCYFFKKLQIEKVFFVSGIYFAPMIAACDKLGITTNEIQHGIVNKYHLAYNFPSIDRYGFFANNFLLLSEFWARMASYPINSNLIIIGNDRYFYKKTISKKDKVITILGDSILSEQIIKYLINNLTVLIDLEFKVIYKLHPAEFADWKNRYPILDNFSKENHVDVYTNELSLQKIFLDSSFVISVNSTAVYEALDAGCKVLILDLPTSEYFDEFVQVGIVKLLNYSKMLSEKDFDFNPPPLKRFFQKTDFVALKTLV